MSLSNHNLYRQPKAYLPEIQEVIEGKTKHLSKLIDPVAVQVAQHYIGTSEQVIERFHYLQNHKPEVMPLGVHPEWAQDIDEMIRLSYTRYAGGTYRSELSNLVNESREYDQTHVAVSRNAIIWATCRSRLFTQGESQSEITSLFEFEDPAYIFQLRAFQEFGRLAFHPLFDVWKAMPSYKDAAKKLQARVLTSLFGAVFATGNRFNIPTLAIFSESVYHYISTNRIVRAVPLKCVPRRSPHRRFLEKNFPRYWCDGNPSVYLLSSQPS